ncbi:MAG: hypothetical protein K9M99_02610 [Candidatus Cloacimonetes bacterium]|nr:hypothetical protein [Candidatus Cloacimonadota bacterium]
MKTKKQGNAQKSLFIQSSRRKLICNWQNGDDQKNQKRKPMLQNKNSTGRTTKQVPAFIFEIVLC